MSDGDIFKGMARVFEEQITAAITHQDMPDVVDWIESEFIVPETRKDPVLRGHLRLEPYHKDTLREIFTKDEEGKFRYDIIVWSDIKKSLKSTIAAGVNLYGARHTEYGEFYIIANDLKQANSRVAEYIRRAIMLNPKLREVFKSVGYKTSSPNGSYIESIPIDPSGEAGSNANMITFSELWGSLEDAKREMWGEMTLSPTKQGESFRWVETYAGFVKESKLLYSLYELGVKQGELLWPDRLYSVTEGEPRPLELYVNREARMLCMWNTLPRCPWQTQRYYQSEEKTQTPGKFRQIHKNEWVTSEETFVPMEWWWACQRSEAEWPENQTGENAPKWDPKRQAMIIAMDAASTNDNFGLVMGCRHPVISTDLLVMLAQKWAPVNGKIDFQGTDEKPGPEKVLRRLISEYNVIMVTFDPHQLHDMYMRLKGEGLAWFKPFNQGEKRLLADSQLRGLIRDRRIWHRGEVDLTEHIHNANAKIDDEDSKVRMVKRTEELKIDLAVALSMDAFELLRLNL